MLSLDFLEPHIMLDLRAVSIAAVSVALKLRVTRVSISEHHSAFCSKPWQYQPIGIQKLGTRALSAIPIGAWSGARANISKALAWAMYWLPFRI